MASSRDILDNNSISSDPFSNDLVEPIEPEFDRIGKHRTHFKWTRDNHPRFIPWWTETEWVVERAGTTDIDWVKRLAWDSQHRTSIQWENFDQAAHRLSGEPALICRKCYTVLTHPNIKNIGTKALQNHISSLSCQKGSMGTSQSNLQQTRIDEQRRSGVSSIKISINSS